MADNKHESPVSVSVIDLLNAGVHFGHQSKRWNPKMKRFIFEKRSGIYIIDLTKSLAQLERAAQFLYETVEAGKNVLFVGTKRQCHEIIKDSAIRSGQFYVVSRWLGGTLTNYENIANSIRHMKEVQDMREKGALDTMPQKEASWLRHELERLERNLTGIALMNGMPGAMVVVDINREAIAVREANRVGIPVVALVDTNCDPDPINYPIPANDDSTRSIKLIINVLTDVIIKACAELNQARAQEPQSKPAETTNLRQGAPAFAKPAMVGEGRSPRREEDESAIKPSARHQEKRTRRGATAKSSTLEKKGPGSSGEEEKALAISPPSTLLAPAAG